MAGMLFGNQTSREKYYWELSKTRERRQKEPFYPSILQDTIPGTIEGSV